MNRLMQARQLFIQRDFAAAIALLQECVAEEPAQAEAWLGLGLALVCSTSQQASATTMNEGLDALRRALAENPADPRAIAAIATTLRGLDRVEEAVVLLQHCAISIPLVLQPTLHIVLAELHACMGNMDALKAELEVLERLPIERPLQRFWLHVEASDSEGLSRAVEELQRYADHPEGAARMEQAEWILKAKIGRAMLAELLHQDELAMELYNQCLHSEHWEPYEGLARDRMEKQEREAGRAFIAEAKRRAPNTVDVLITEAALQKSPQAHLLLLQISQAQNCTARERKRAALLLQKITQE